MKLVDDTVTNFTNLMASSEPAPGGGSAAALEGALGAALTAMVCALTQGKKKYAAFEDLAKETEQKANVLKERYLDVLDRDTDAFHKVSAVFSMPKNTDDEKAVRSEAMQKALKGCTETPFEIMELACETLDLITGILDRSNTSTKSDLGCAALSLKSAAQCAWLNVLINLGEIKDSEFVDTYRKNGAALLEKAIKSADSIYLNVVTSL